MPPAKPIMIHSLFRAGSTYIFNIFRRSSGYWCYQEPLHEIFSDRSSEAQWRVQSGAELRTTDLRHPQLDKPYFWEFSQCADVVESLYQKEFAFESYFADKDAAVNSKLRSYIEGLGAKAAGRPVFQFCRSTGRMAWFRKEFDAIQLHLWRNPWDQWLSYKIDHYFDNTLKQIYSCSNLPNALADLRNHPSVTAFRYQDRDSDAYRLSCDIPLILDPEQSYLLFYGLWAWSLLASRGAVHEQINIDSLSTSPQYREQIIEKLLNLGIAGISFHDACVSQNSFCEKDEIFFRKIESIVHEKLLSNGLSKEDLEWIDQQRNLHLPINRKASEFHIENSFFDLYRRIGLLTKNFWIGAEQQAHEVTALKAKVSDLESELVFLREKTKSFERQCADLAAQLNESSSRERDLLNSASWRITAPLRKLRNLTASRTRGSGGESIKSFIKVHDEIRFSPSKMQSTDLVQYKYSIFSLDVQERRRIFLEWLECNTLTQYDRDHKLRFWETYLRLEDYLSEEKQVLELGGESKITNYLKNQMGMVVDVYGEDLRYSFNVDADTYEIVLCLEVIEHIKDRVETGGISEIAMFTRSGVRNVFHECKRVLKEGGVLFITTPNACCIDSIAKIFNYEAPQLYAPHVKEYSAIELNQIAKEFDFELIAYSTANVWNPHPTIDRDRIMGILAESKIPIDDRGDDMFMAFKKK